MQILRAMLKGFCAVALALALGGCTAGVSEFVAYDAAFDIQHNQGNQVLDDLADAERQLARRVLAEELDEQFFDPDFAGYYIDAGDAPATASLRANLNALRLYNKVLLGIANGDGAALQRARVTEMIGTFRAGVAPFNAEDQSADPAANATASTTAARAKLTDLCGACELTLQLSQQILPGLEQAVAQVNYQRFREEVVNQQPNMAALLDAFREGAARMYRTMVRANSGTSFGEGTGIREADRARVAAFRQELAKWVLMIDETQIAMQAAADAAAAGGRGELSAQRLLRQSIELERISAATN
ncbi:hypothetical protein KUV51_08900 [Tateyamaria omphalii]|uniref:hypothetical protein n=1 Tax=Tateyamaria omphalii TaxID=299262 RepID=UPI001C99DAAE|nr:hypothetical protein [Tateyamaria omphalii]MBY5933111.1 hypothetical protein [Tateyamaria omphalii]